MTKYTTNDGDKFEAKTALEVVQHLRATSWTMTKDPHEKFMQDMAARVLEQTGAVVPTDTPEAFVDGLVGCGLLKEEA